MRLEHLRVERFGARSPFSLGAFSSRLNIIYGAADADIRTAIQFIRWMLYGKCDGSSHPYLLAADGAACGSMTVVQAGLRCTIARQDDGTRHGRLAIDTGVERSRKVNSIQALLGDVTPRQFDQLYGPCFKRKLDCELLLRTAASRSLQPATRQLTAPRAADVKRRIDRCRRDLQQLGLPNHSVSWLTDRLRTLQLRARALANRRRVSAKRMRNRLEDLGYRIARLGLRVERWRAKWHAYDQSLAKRQRELRALAVRGSAQPSARALHRALPAARARLKRAADIVDLVSRRDRLGQRLAEAELSLGRLIARRREVDRRYRHGSHDELSRVRRQLTRVESELRVARNREQRKRELESWETELARLAARPARSPAIRHAGRLLRRLSDGRLVGIRVRACRVWVENQAGRYIGLRSAPRRARNRVYLCLCLSLIEACRGQGVELPLILDDPFGSGDAAKNQVAAEVLQEFAARGQQVLLFTRHRDIAQLFQGHDVRYFELRLSDRPEAAVQAVEPIRFRQRVPGPLDPAAAESGTRPRLPRRRLTPPPEPRAEIPPTSIDGEDDDQITMPQGGRITERCESSGDEGSQPELWFGLDQTDSVADATWIGPRAGRRLSEIGIRTVGDLISADPADLSARMSHVRITKAMIVQWQVQARLVCRVPRLAAHDARILAACGVDDPQELARWDIDDLWKRVQAFSRSSRGKRILRGRRVPHRVQVAEWVRWAAHARPLHAA